MVWNALPCVAAAALVGVGAVLLFACPAVAGADQAHQHTAGPMPLPAEDARRITHLVEWVREKGGWVDGGVEFALSPPQQIRREAVHGVAGDEGQATAPGIGVFATKDLPANLTVFQIPLATMINIEHALADEDVGVLWDMLPDLTDIEVLAGFLLLEANRRPHSESYWKPYLDVLFNVVQAPLTPLLFTENELAYLQASDHAHITATTRIQNTQEAFELIYRAATEALEGTASDSWHARKFSWPSYLEAMTLLRSRTHMVSVKDGSGEWQETMCLVPLADFVNTGVQSSSANMECFTRGRMFLCHTTQHVSAGEELLTDYFADHSRRSSAKMLLEYGFIPAPHSHDTVPIELPNLPSRAEEGLKGFHFRDAEPIAWVLEKENCYSLRVVLYYAIKQLEARGIDVTDKVKVHTELLEDEARVAALEEFLEMLDGAIESRIDAVQEVVDTLTGTRFHRVHDGDPCVPDTATEKVNFIDASAAANGCHTFPSLAGTGTPAQQRQAAVVRRAALQLVHDLLRNELHVLTHVRDICTTNA